MNMIEKVAFAIENAHDKNPQYTRSALLPIIAKAAIEAMREPTEEMIEATNYKEFGEMHWKAMIDAALKE